MTATLHLPSASCISGIREASNTSSSNTRFSAVAMEAPKG